MALIRLTPDNAEEVIQQVVGDFAELVRNSGKSPALAKLTERTEELEGLVGSGVLEVEVILGQVADQWVGPVAKWLQIDEPSLREAISSQEQVDLPLRFDRRFSVVRIRSGQAPTGRRAGQRQPPILVAVHTPEQAPDKNLKDAIFDAVQEHPLSLLLVPADAGWAKALSKLASQKTWMCKAIGLELMFERDLEENLELSPWKEAGPLMVGWSTANSMGSLYDGLGLALEKEQRSLKSKRTVLDQKAAVNQAKATGNASEIIGEVRGYIQKQFDIFQKESAKRMQSLVAPFEGTLSQEIEATIKGFSEFDFEKKPKIFVVRVPMEVQNHLLTRSKEALAEAGRADLVRMGEVFRTVQEEAERLVESKGGPPTVVHFHYLPDHELTNLLDRSIGIQRPYSGTLARRGPMDYFMAARRYQMIFFMMFSAFGLSFVRSYRQIMVPLTVLLLSFGLLNVVNSTRKQEKETQQLELEKARELLRAELRRCMNEIDKTWSSILSGHLAAQQAAVVENIESTVNSFFEGASRKATDDKVLQQRQIKGLDQSERRIAETNKKILAAPQELEQLNTQLVQMFSAAVRPGQAGARPGAPAAAGTPGVPRPAAPAATPAAAAVPAAAAEALKKLQTAKKGAPGARPAAGRGAADLKKKPPRVPAKTPAATKPAAKKAGDVAAQAARLKEKAAAVAKTAKKPAAGAAVAGAASEAPAAGKPADAAAKLREKAAVIAKATKDPAAKAAVAEAAAKVEKPAADDKVHPKRAAVEKRVAELQKKMQEAQETGVSDKEAPSPKPEAESGSDQLADRGEAMRKKAEEIKKKMSNAAAESERDQSADLDKTVMMPKRPISNDSDTPG